MLKIPAWFIPTKKVDYESEVFQFLGGFRKFGKLTLPAPYTCYYSLLELVTSQFFLDPLGCRGRDAATALHILIEGKRALPLIYDSLRGGKRLEREAARFWRRHSGSVIDHYEGIVEWLLVTPCEGFDMLPSGQESKKPFWFDAEYLAGNVAVAARATGMTMDEVLWALPFAALGHIIAADARREGVKGVGRKPDKEVLAREMDAARERESAGMLHPWQERYPERYEPSRTQVEARLEILREWESLKNADKHQG